MSLQLTGQHWLYFCFVIWSSTISSLSRVRGGLWCRTRLAVAFWEWQYAPLWCFPLTHWHSKNSLMPITPIFINVVINPVTKHSWKIKSTHTLRQSYVSLFSYNLWSYGQRVTISFHICGSLTKKRRCTFLDSQGLESLQPEQLMKASEKHLNVLNLAFELVLKPWKIR